MATPPIIAPVSHKRTNSAASNNAEAPKVKRQASHTATLAYTPKSGGSDQDPHYVYVVIVESNPQYTETRSDIHAIYATVKDANNAVKGIVNSEYSGSEETKQGSEDDGRIYWSSDDAGEGERVEVYIRVMEVKQPGSELEREWANGGVDDLASGEDYSEERDSEEEEENEGAE